MKIKTSLSVRLGLFLVISSVGSVSAQTDVGKTILEKLTAKVTKLESTCAKDIKKYWQECNAWRRTHGLLHASLRGQDKS